MHGLRSLSANGLSNINKIHIHNLCHHCHIHNVFHFRSVHYLSFQVLFLFTNIQSLSISLYFIFRLSLSVFSLFSHIHRHSSDMYTIPLSFSLALSSASLTYLLSSVVDPPVSFCFSLYLSLYFMRTQPIIICRRSLTTVQYISKISQK